MKLVIAPYTLYSFFVGGFITLLWAFIVLIVPLRVQTPNTSFYPEIDIASKVVADSTDMAQLLWPLSNSHSPAIKRRLQRERFFARMEGEHYNRRVALMLEDNGNALTNRKVIPQSTEYRTEELLEHSRRYL